MAWPPGATAEVTSATFGGFRRLVAAGRHRAFTPVSSGDERVAVMSEFQQEIQIRLDTATRSLEEAQRDGDDYLAQIRLGEIESLHRLAEEHGAVA
jgi:hypothetical protein